MLNLSQNPFTRLQSGDYKQLSIEQAQRMAQNLQPVQKLYGSSSIHVRVHLKWTIRSDTIGHGA